MNHVGSPAKAYDFLLKFLLVGDSDVGKGEILASLEDGAAESPYGYHMGKRRWGAPLGTAEPQLMGIEARPSFHNTHIAQRRRLSTHCPLGSLREHLDQWFSTYGSPGVLAYNSQKSQPV
uniref:Uncharacterized protein n=1 Tax=Anolis carolinensis TaxID=28377 RepID=A0A803TM16_ANOCA